jgi:hypothetical protein
MSNCVGFIDCTRIQMQRPGRRSSNRRSVDSGHNRFQCLAYQAITVPDGHIFHVYGPDE